MSLRRRDFLGTLVAAGIGAAGLPGMALAGDARGRRLPWRNWSGSQQCLPEKRLAPASLDELRTLLAVTRGTVRPVGAGHSFTALVPTDDTILSLSRMSGVDSHDPETLQATVWTGTRLGDLGAPLDAVGQALVNMPDIDEQALGGCLATATHGTGLGIGCMSTFVTALELMDARGELHQCSARNNPDLFNAALVSLGTLGIITRVTLQNTAPYRLREEMRYWDIDDLLDAAPSMAQAHRNFEFYFIPFSGVGASYTHDITDEPISATEQVDTNDAVYDLQRARDLLSWSPTLRQMILKGYISTLDDEVVVERSWKNYASERNVRFNEMEYHLPLENGIDALREVRAALETRHPEVFFPIEVRFVAGDELWLSPFSGRDTCSIAVHRYFEEDYRPYFRAIEPIFRRHGGRPHWGKLNTLGREDFRALYPRFDEFVAVRREIDPDGRFLNSYLASLFT